MALSVTKRDGTREPFNANRINEALALACEGLSNPIGLVAQLASETELTLFDGITTVELDEAIIHTTVQNSKDDPEYDQIAARLLRKTMYKTVLGSYETAKELQWKHRGGFSHYIYSAVKAGLLDTRLASKKFDLKSLSYSLDLSRDDQLKYIGVVTMKNRYMIKSRNQQLMETPQYFWMRVAMGLSLNEVDATSAALAFYHKLSNLEYIAAGSTLMNVGTPYPQLSNCFVAEMQDDLDHIGKTVGDVMKLTKGTGGIGLAVSKLRAQGSVINQTNSFSTGPIPFMHTIDSVLRAVSRGGKKFGALCFYIENWHLDFPAFLDLKENSGDPYRRLRTANTAVWLSDEFMSRVKDDQPWYLFDPQDVPDLTELYGSAFSARYRFYIREAEAGRIPHFVKLGAREQFKAMLISLQTTSHPWLTWKDTINNRALNNNTGTIHLSNLCTEITLPQDRDNIAVCNLASVNLAQHLSDGVIDWERLDETVRLAVRQLDNLIDITLSKVPEAEHANELNRAVGLGVMGFTDLIEQLELSYDSEAAAELMDSLMERVSYTAIKTSAELAQERGAYANFMGSGWSKGLVPIDTLSTMARDRGIAVTVPGTMTLDWDELRSTVKNGMRNATLLAVAPTASIGLVAGTTPGIDPQFSQIFSRATSSGKFLEMNVNLVQALKKLGLWEALRDTILERQGDISELTVIPESVRCVYRTSFQLPPSVFITIAARAQKWVDQAISRNMYLESRDVTEMMKVYLEAWEQGLKTTYYLHMKPRHSAEQSTIRVNKAESVLGGSGVGFGFAAASPPPVAVPAGPLVCPVDPAELAACEACQ